MFVGHERPTTSVLKQGDKPSKLVKYATLKIYARAPHGLASTHNDQLNADLLAFLKT
jgi:non-heme chloroperoxidase